MQKDVIYIDVDDDITAIIGKVKAADHQIVAVVPPKRIGVLQSAVNVRLVNRAATQAKKKLVLITNNSALMGLAAAASIPVAKNLQSRPEIPEIAALSIDEGEDTIDGAQLPVGEHAQTAEKTADPLSAKAATASALGPVAVAGAVKTAPSKLLAKAKSSAKVPNFNTTRKKIFLFGGGGLLLIGLLVWALVFAPSAKIIIAARTTTSAVSTKITLGSGLETDVESSTLRSTVKETSKEVSVPISPTGKKDVGEKATGTATVYVTDAAELDIFRNDKTYTMPAGTVLTASNGKTFTTDSTVSFGPSNIRSSEGKSSVKITATANGSSFNGATGTLNGAPNGMRATLSSSTTAGGTDKSVPVVTQSDVDTAMGKVNEQANSSEMKSELSKQLAGAVIIDASFKTDASSVQPSVPVDQDFGATAPIVKGQVKYTMSAVEKTELNKFLDTHFKKQIDGAANQKVYDNGAADVNFTNVSSVEQGFAATISTNGKIGPRIDEAALKTYAKGKRYGDIQSHIEAINGVDSADVKFSPFWVTAAPNNEKRITIEFKLNDA